MNRQEAYDSLFSARSLFFAGLLIMPALLFNPVTEYRVVQFLFFWFLSWLCGKKTNPAITVLVVFFIVAFNLIVPYGRVLFSAGWFKITSGSLAAGIHRAATLEALVMLSKICVRHDLRLPGAFGGLLSESMRIFSVLLTRKHGITAKNIITVTDNLMLELSESFPEPASSRVQRTKPAGFLVLIAVILASWSPWIFIL